MPDHSLPFRQAVVAHLRMDEAVRALVGERVYEKLPKGEAQWPFVRYRRDDVAPFDLTGSAGSEIAFTIHTFAHGPETDGSHILNEAIRAALDDAPIVLGDDAGVVSIDWIRTQNAPDISPNDHHGMVEFVARTGS